MSTRGTGLGRAAHVLIVGVAMAGVGALLAHLVNDGAWTADDVVALASVAAAVAAAQRFLLPFRYRLEAGSFDVSDAALAAGLALARPSPLLAGVLVGTILAQASQRIAAVKIAFNVGQHLVGLGLASVAYAAIEGSDPFPREEWLAVVVGMSIYLVVNEALVDLVISIVERTSFVSVLRGSLAFSVAHWATNVALGLIAIVLWGADRWALLFLVAPFLLAHLAYRNVLRARRERDQIADLSRTAEAISLESDLARRMPPLDETPVLASLSATLNRMLGRLEGAFQRERRFIRDASHELRTPVTVTRGYLEVLGPEPTGEELSEAVEVALDELDRMGRLITDLTTLAKVDDPGFLLPGQIRVSAFLDQIAAKAKPLLGERLTTTSPALDGVLAVDVQRLTQAVLNLLTNAALHTRAQSPVRLRAVAEPGAWRLEVDDSGGGLPEGSEEALFDAFRRVDEARPGSGLGLAIVKGIAEAHGGSAGADNRPGEGATFWIRVPR